jgi:aminocarboxymuconate-semialdehyde decarboxylase
MPQLDSVDFHCHHIPARFAVTAGHMAPPDQRARWEALARKLSDEDLLLADIRNGDVGARVVNIPAQLIGDADGRVPHETIVAMNDDLAELVVRHPGRIHGLASVDAYDGDTSACEVERAIHDLAGSDWPIVPGPSGVKLEEAMRQAGLSAGQQAAIAGGNSRRLLGI